MRKYFPILILLLITILLSSIVWAEDNNSLNDSIISVEKTTATNELSDKSNDKSVDKVVADNKVKSTVSDNDNLTRELDDETEGTGCSSVIIQGYNNDSSISFRRDATNKLTVNVKHNNTIVKQYKENSYFFHVIVSKDGWIVGNGGADNAAVNRAIESNALTMISKNTITTANMNNIYKQEAKLSLGHFVIKAPNGAYSLIIKNGKNTFKSSGVLKAGQYLIVPNSKTYYRKSTVDDIKTESSMIKTSRMLAARDKFGVNRREIVTYYYKNNVVNSVVKVSATNDNGKYVGRKTSAKIDNFRTNTKYFASSSIPILDNSIQLDTINFFIRKTKTSISSQNMVVNGDNVELKINVKDEFGKNVNAGLVSLTIDGNPCKYSNGSLIYFDVKNGEVSYKTKLNNMWNNNNHTYSATYYSNSNYEGSVGSKSTITIINPVNVGVVHNHYIYCNGRISITSTVKYNQNNTFVNDGKVFYKINGITIKDARNETLTFDVKNGVSSYNYTFDSKYSAKVYNLTTIYINGIYRQEIVTNFTIMKIPVKIASSKILVKGNMLYFKGKLVNKNDKLIKYAQYLGVKIDGKTLKTDGKTNLFNITNGVISFKFKLPADYKTGNHTLTIVIPEFAATKSLRQNYTMTIVKV